MKTLIKPLLLIFSFTFFLIVFASCEHPVPPPEQTISMEEANNLEETFKETRSVVIDSVLGYQDTREFWFSLETLKDYIKYVEYEAGQQEISNLGVRVYFAAYPQSGNDPFPAGYSTVFFVPTSTQEPSPVQRGFAPIQAENENIPTIDPLNFGHGGQPPIDY